VLNLDVRNASRWKQNDFLQQRRDNENGKPQLAYATGGRISDARVMCRAVPTEDQKNVDSCELVTMTRAIAAIRLNVLVDKQEDLYTLTSSHQSAWPGLA